MRSGRLNDRLETFWSKPMQRQPTGGSARLFRAMKIDRKAIVSAKTIKRRRDCVSIFFSGI